MTRFRFSGRYLVSASWGSYMWLSASNTGKESSRDGMAISLKYGFSQDGNDVTTSVSRAVIGRSSGRSVGQFRGRAVDDGEVHGCRGEQPFLAVTIAEDVDLHDHRPTAVAQHPRHRVCHALTDRAQVADVHVGGGHRGALLQMLNPEVSARDVDERGDQTALQGAGGVDHLRAHGDRHRELAIVRAGPHPDLVE